MLSFILIFIAGFFEFVIRVIDYKAIQRSKCFYSAIITFINIWVWYYIIASVVENLNNFWLIFVYAIGCALGNYVTLKLDMRNQKNVNYITPQVLKRSLYMPDITKCINNKCPFKRNCYRFTCEAYELQSTAFFKPVKKIKLDCKYFIDKKLYRKGTNK